jgi:hypothetical protein
MTEGIRLRCRPELGFPDGAMIVVTDHARPLPPPRSGRALEDVIETCRTCGVQHFAKTYHLQLRAGSVIVSSGVWEALQRLADHPFQFVNTVGAPPAQGIVPWSEKPVSLIEKFVMPISTGALNGHG